MSDMTSLSILTGFAAPESLVVATLLLHEIIAHPNSWRPAKLSHGLESCQAEMTMSNHRPDGPMGPEAGARARNSGHYGRAMPVMSGLTRLPARRENPAPAAARTRQRPVWNWLPSV